MIFSASSGIFSAMMLLEVSLVAEAEVEDARVDAVTVPGEATCAGENTLLLIPHFNKHNFSLDKLFPAQDRGIDYSEC